MGQNTRRRTGTARAAWLIPLVAIAVALGGNVAAQAASGRVARPTANGCPLAKCPSGYSFAVNEGNQFTITGSADVAFGAKGHFVYQYGVTGTIDCSTTTFGDPAPFVSKVCSTRADEPITGDWRNYGVDHVGRAQYNPATGWTWLENPGSQGGGEIKFKWGGQSGNPTACQPITGDWNNYGLDHVGLACYDASTGWTWHEATGTKSGGDIVFQWGLAAYSPSSCQAITGDWKGYGLDHVGLACYDATTGWTWHEDTGKKSGAELTFGWGGASLNAPSCRPITGDWANYGLDHIGLGCYDPSTGWTWHKDTGTRTGGEIVFGWGGVSGNPPSCQPMAGDWASYGLDHVGVGCYDASTGWTWREDTGTEGGGEIVFGWGGP